jgi:calmodulin
MLKHFRNCDYEENLRSAFKVFDKDGNGFISRKELKQAMAMLDPNLNDADIDDMLKEADENNDGLINYEGRHEQK